MSVLGPNPLTERSAAEAVCLSVPTLRRYRCFLGLSTGHLLSARLKPCPLQPFDKISGEIADGTVRAADPAKRRAITHAPVAAQGVVAEVAGFGSSTLVEGDLTLVE